MNLPVRSAHTEGNPEGLRTGDKHIHQRFGDTQVTGGIALQGNFVGVTISECILLGNHCYHTYNVQILQRPGLTTKDSSHTPRSSP